MTTSISDQLAAWAVDVMDALGGPGAALVVGLDNLFPPIPSELVLPLAGFAANRGTFSLVEALAWTTLGSVVGAAIVYLVGARLGRDRVRRLVVRLPLVDVDDVDRAERWFARHGAVAVLVGRMVPLVRSAISLPAGVERMPMTTFLALTTLGSLVWNTLLVTAGYLLGAHWGLVERWTGVVQTAAVAALAAGLVWFVVTRLRTHSARGRHARQEPPTRPTDRRA